MKRTLFFTALLSLLSLIGWAQERQQLPFENGQTLENTHDELIKGVYVRHLRQYESNPTLKQETQGGKVKGKDANKEGIDPSEIRSTAYIMRFEPAFERLKTDFYGQVFVGDRYYLDKFQAHYRLPNQFRQDRKGSFYLYKLSLHETPRRRWASVIIFSEMPTNLCNKQMHRNSHVCITGEQHRAAVLAAAKDIVPIEQIDPRRADVFSVKNEYKEFSMDWDETKLAELRLKHTKYAYSTDPFLQTSYTLPHFPDAEQTGVDKLIDRLITLNDFRQSAPGGDIQPIEMPSAQTALAATTTVRPTDIPRTPTDSVLIVRSAPRSAATPADSSRAEQGGGWIYAGIVAKDQKSWYTTLVDLNLPLLHDSISAVEAIVRVNTYVRDRPPVETGSQLTNGKEIGVFRAGTHLTVRDKRFIADSKSNAFYLWIQVNQQPPNSPAVR